MSILNNQEADEADKDIEQADLKDSIDVIEKVREIREIQHKHSGSKRYKLLNLAKIQKFEGNLWVTYDETLVNDEYNLHMHYYDAWDLNFKKRKLSIKQKTLDILKNHAEFQVQLSTPVNHQFYEVSPHASRSSSSSASFEVGSPLVGRSLIQPSARDTTDDPENESP